MVVRVNLDAMIPRADFAATTGDATSAEKIPAFSIEQLGSNSLLVHRLKKPDFQRETTHWTPQQLVTFLKSYLDNELVPSVILWQSPSHVFVIDGGHRISALRAWVEDDYGDGHISTKFYAGTIPEDQKRTAQRVRRMVTQEIGTFQLLKSVMLDPEKYPDEIMKRRSRNVVTRSLSLQWVEGDAEKAETSFFKINTQGTPLDKTEERLLRERRNPIAIAARSIVRAGTGHKYWSRFEDDVRKDIEKYALDLHGLLFQPEIREPIKTLDLPLGGKSSPIGALNMLMDFIEVAARESGTPDNSWVINVEDADGSGTVRALQKCAKIMRRITGNDAGSLGLHPAVYFYNHRGKHNIYLFLAITGLFARAVQDNNSDFFKTFSSSRSKLEQFLVENKALINQAIIAIGSSTRVTRLQAMFRGLVEKFANDEDVSIDELLIMLQLQGKLVASELEVSATEFSDETKSAIYLKQSLQSAVICPICGGYVDASKSASYDHVERKSEGGTAAMTNGQMTHPYCNTGIKS